MEGVLASEETFSGVYSLSLWFKHTSGDYPTLAWGTGDDYVQLYGPDVGAGRYAIVRGYAIITSGSGVYDFDAWNHFMLVRDSSDGVQAWINTSSIGTASKSGDVALTLFGTLADRTDGSFGVF